MVDKQQQEIQAALVAPLQNAPAGKRKTRARRGRGEGAIYQRGDGLWTACVSLGYDGDGKRQRRVVYGATKQEVQTKLNKLQRDGAGVLGEADKLTVGQYLDRWLTIVKPTVEPNTYGPYERHVRLHLRPHIGGVRLAKLVPLHVEQLYTALGENGVKPALARKVGTTLTIAMGEAVRLHLLAHNPAGEVRKPKAAKVDMQVLDPDQVMVFLDAAKVDRLYAFYVTALDSGGRPGELFALQWSDVDLAAGVLRITKSLEEISGNLRVKEVKTKKGRRQIPLSPFTVRVLEEHRKDALAAGHINGPVFCDTLGGYLRLSNLHKNSFKPILAKAELPSIRLYDLRHTCATLLLLADENPKIVSERLGHASIQLTLDTYSHVLPTMQQRAAVKMDLILGRKAPERAKA
jgi:integrase